MECARATDKINVNDGVDSSSLATGHVESEPNGIAPVNMETAENKMQQARDDCTGGSQENRLLEIDLSIDFAALSVNAFNVDAHTSDTQKFT